jgi:hypothetical protein
MSVKLINCEKQLNDLARQQFISKMLEEILFDMNICRLNGWDIFEFPNLIKKEIERICKNDRQV